MPAPKKNASAAAESKKVNRVPLKTVLKPIFFCSTEAMASHGVLEITAEHVVVWRNPRNTQQLDQLEEAMVDTSLHDPLLTRPKWSAPRDVVSFSYHPGLRMFSIVQESIFVVVVFVFLEARLTKRFEQNALVDGIQWATQYIPCGPLHQHLTYEIKKRSTGSIPSSVLPSKEGVHLKTRTRHAESDCSLNKEEWSRNVAEAVRRAGFDPCILGGEGRSSLESPHALDKPRPQSSTVSSYHNHHRGACYEPFIVPHNFFTACVKNVRNEGTIWQPRPHPFLTCTSVESKVTRGANAPQVLLPSDSTPKYVEHILNENDKLIWQLQEIITTEDKRDRECSVPQG